MGTSILDELKWRSKVKHPIDCPRRRNLYIVASDFGDIATSRYLSEALSHPGKCIVGMEKPARNWIDQTNSARHVR